MVLSDRGRSIFSTPVVCPGWARFTFAAAMLSVTCSGCSGSDESSGNDAARNTPVCAPAGPGHTSIVKNASGFALMRDGAPYYIKGIAGQARIEAASQYGANSTRTYSSGNATS